MGFKNNQKVSFNRLIQESLPKLIEGKSFKTNKYSVQYSMYPTFLNNVRTQNGTDFIQIKAKVCVTNCINGSSVDFIVDLLNLPVFTELGFKIKNNYMQVLDLYERALGPCFSKKTNSKNETKYFAEILGKFGHSFMFQYDTKRIPLVIFKRGVNSDKSNISVSTFFRAITGMTDLELLGLFGYSNPFIVSAFSDNARFKPEADKYNLAVRSECIDALAAAMFGAKACENRQTLLKERDIQNYLFNANYLDLGSGNLERLDYVQSFRNRASSKVLAETISVDGKTFYEGEILNDDILDLIDNSPISTLKVNYNNKVYELHKFSTFTFRALGFKLAKDACGIKAGTTLTLEHLAKLNSSDLTKITVNKVINVFGTDESTDVPETIDLVRRVDASTLTVDDLFTVFSIFTDNLNGFDTFDNQYELTNRILVSYDKRVCDIVSKNVDYISNSLKTKFDKLSDDDEVLTALDNYSEGIVLNEFIELVAKTDNREGQMSDITNILSFATKSEKITTDIDADNITQDLVNVQDLQEGRLDPYDVPESDKIGIVHHKTVLSKITDDGYITAPYLPVKDGRLISKEPVYLTATQEINKYISTWNEPFFDENGNLKELVQARLNGNIISVNPRKVNYMEYSPFQSMSVAHAMITFPEHSNGKRITMSCHHSTQAVSILGNQRPLVGTGAESIFDLGTYTADSVLDNYWEYVSNLRKELNKYKDKILNSPLILQSLEEYKGNRIASFRVEAVTALRDAGITEVTDMAQLSIPYHMKNMINCMYSFKINHKKDKIYHRGDVIAYNTSYSLDKKPILQHGSFGVQEPEQNVFDKGLALGVNLCVVYKTWEGSTIDDAITISDRLLYDDVLTSVSIYEVKAELHKDEAKSEIFAYYSKKKSYFTSNGLPEIGTFVKAGDPVISKIVKTDSKSRNILTYLPETVDGQVIHTEIVDINGVTTAKVLIATMSPIEVGDKMAGRHGNKGVIAKIVPQDQMPYDPVTGMTADVVLNPLGIPSRQNISQILEGPLAMCMEKYGGLAIVPPYNPNNVAFVKENTNKYNVHPIKMIDGRTGLYYENPVNMCMLYLYKLEHMVNKKIHSIGTDAPIDPVFLQPRRGRKNQGGQTIGEMESWCLESVGATKVMQELYTVQSDDTRNEEQFINMLNGEFKESYVSGDNSNTYTMLAYYRSLGVDIVIDSSDSADSFTFKPLTSERIRSFAARPVDNESALHSPDIFGKFITNQDKFESRSKWGWIELNCDMVSPLFIRKGHLHNLIIVKTSKVEPMSGKRLDELIKGKLFINVDEFSGPVVLHNVNSSNDEDVLQNTLTGIAALTFILKNYNIQITKNYLEDAVGNSKLKMLADNNGVFDVNNSKYLEDVEKLAFLEKFIESGISLSDYVIDAFPIMPQIYRPIVPGVRGVPDFDWHYQGIMQAAKVVKNDGGVDNLYKLYERIGVFMGLIAPDKALDYQTVSSWFGGKDSKGHGKIREAVQSKKIKCSGRTVIIPAADTSMKPTELGVPAMISINIFYHQLASYFSRKASTHIPPNTNFKKLFSCLAEQHYGQFKKVYRKDFFSFYGMKPSTAYKTMMKWLINCIEGKDEETRKVVLSVRQPSLHKYSNRAFFNKVVFTKAIQIHPLVCEGYNADFDGDQMLVGACSSEEARDEALALLSPAKDFINPKNSSIILKHNQDIVLGTYVATMLKDNATTLDGNESINFYSSLKSLETDLKSGVLSVHDLVCLNYCDSKYLSTAGRILFNSLLIDGFTDNEFTNVLNIPGIKKEHYKGLLYDGIVSQGKGSVGCLVYYNLKDICKDLYLKRGESCINEYQSISEFGFYWADRYGITISFEDLELQSSSKDDILSVAEQKKAAIEQDYLDGLISAEDKKNALIYIYADKETGANAKIQKVVIDSLTRDNNIFIMMDSGARGNATQVTHMCGTVGVLQKTKTEDLETSVTSNYFEGLSSFDVHLASYSSRTGVASTQRETRSAGYATRQAVYMQAGTKIVEYDCDKQDWWYDVQWDSHLEEKDRFIPSVKFFKKNLLGRGINESASDDIFKGFSTITEECYDVIVKADGFNQLTLDGGSVIKANLDLIVNSKLDKNDKIANKYLKNFLHNGHVTKSCLRLLESNHIMSVDTDKGKLLMRYKMHKMSEGLLKGREARNLPYLRKTSDIVYGKSINVITDETIKYVEDNGITRIEARILLDCRSKHGICARCFGLKYSNLQLPAIGEYVGFEAAQSIGEPSAQLTMSLINKGGVAGESIANGVDIFNNLLKGNISDCGVNAKVSKLAGYVNVKKLDDSIVLSVDPISYDNPACKKCMRICNSSTCPKGGDEVGRSFLCTIMERVKTQKLLHKDKEFVKAGDALTSEPVHPDSIEFVENNSRETLLRKKQIVWLENFFNTFMSNNIFINVRHFELFARLQNFYVTVVESKDSKFKVGDTYEVSEVLDNPLVEYRMRVSKQDEVVLKNSGPFAALSFIDTSSVAAKIANVGYHGTNDTSPIGKLSIGINLAEGKLKNFKENYYTAFSKKQDKDYAFSQNQVQFGTRSLFSAQDAINAFNANESFFSGIDSAVSLDFTTNVTSFDLDIDFEDDFIKQDNFSVESEENLDNTIENQEFYTPSDKQSVDYKNIDVVTEKSSSF